MAGNEPELPSFCPPLPPIYLFPWGHLDSAVDGFGPSLEIVRVSFHWGIYKSGSSKVFMDLDFRVHDLRGNDSLIEYDVPGSIQRYFDQRGVHIEGPYNAPGGSYIKLVNLGQGN